MKKSKFYIEVKLLSGYTQQQWTMHAEWSYLVPAMDHVTRLRDAKYANGNRVFDGIRIRYRGLTLSRWKDGYLA
jgi:hypothetical protein